MESDRELSELEQEVFDEFTELVRKEPGMDVDAFLSLHPPTSPALRELCETAAVVAWAASITLRVPGIPI